MKRHPSPAPDVRCTVQYYTLQSKSSPLSGLLSGIVPSIVAMATPQKAAGIGKMIVYLLSFPRLAQYQILPQLALKYQPLKLPSPCRQSLYMLPTTPERPLPHAVPAVLSRHAFDDAPERASIEATLTLPESIRRVALC